MVVTVTGQVLALVCLAGNVCAQDASFTRRSLQKRLDRVRPTVESVLGEKLARPAR